MGAELYEIFNEKFAFTTILENKWDDMDTQVRSIYPVKNTEYIKII
ncbi:MAG TPA: hypothetical protein VK073_02765 [Pseudogracilibacillus sp.]|nr:hypothetical protein [Pseudogracilibacillus sp.]